jgi:hypothetical protein
MLTIFSAFSRVGATVVSLMGSGAVFLAAAADNVSLLGSAGFTAFALTGFTLMFKSWRKELNRLSWNLRKVDRQKTILLNALLKEGKQIPPSYYAIEQAETEEELRSA